MSLEKPVECMTCGERFGWEQLNELKACPNCGSSSIPMDHSEDIMLKINPHELRVLTIWADNYAQMELKPRADSQNAVKGFKRLLARIREQVKFPLTIADEVKEVASHFETRAIAVRNGHVIAEADGTLPQA